MVEKLNKVVHIERQLVQRLGREPRPEEIAEELEIDVDEVREILRMSQLPISLEKPIGEEEDSSLGDFVPDDAAESPSTRRRSRCGARTSSSRWPRSPSATACDRASVRPRRLAAVHARGGRAGVRRHARAHPPDREQHAEEARIASGGAGAQRLRLAFRAWRESKYVGHATVFVDLDGVRLLTDPLLRNRVAHLRRASGSPRGRCGAWMRSSSRTATTTTLTCRRSTGSGRSSPSSSPAVSGGSCASGDSNR